MPLAPYLYRYRPLDGSDPDPVSPVALMPPDDGTTPAFDPSMSVSDFSQTQNPIPPAPPSITSAAQDLRLPTNGQSGANAIPLQLLNPPNGNGGGSPSYTGLKQLAASMPPPGSPPPASPSPVPPPPVADESTSAATALAPSIAPATPPPATAPSSPTVGTPAATQAAMDQLNDLRKNRPAVPVGNWAQRLGGAVLAMTKLAPVANQIIHPKYSQQQADYQAKVEDQEAQLKELETAEDIGTKGQQRQANALKLTSQAQELADVPAQKKAAALEAQHKAFVESMGKSAIEITPGDQIPSGYHAFQDPADPNKLWVRPSAFIALPKELLPMFPGKKEGDLVTSGEYDTGQQAFRTQQLENLKADNKPDKVGESQWIDDALNPDPTVSGPAKAKLALLAKQRQADRPVTNINNIPMSGDATDMAADLYLKTGNLPAMGMGSSGATARAAVLNRAAEKLKTLGGGDVATNKATYSALNQSLGQLQKLYGLTSAFENNTRDNMKLLESASQATDRTGSPLINSYLLAAKTGIFGDPETAKLNDAVKTVANEVAKIRSGQQGGSATDSARAEAMESIHGAMAKGQLSAVANQMRQEMKNRTSELLKQIQDAKTSINSIGGANLPAAEPVSATVHYAVPGDAAHPNGFDIPVAREQDFLKAHPNAKKQ